MTFDGTSEFAVQSLDGLRLPISRLAIESQTRNVGSKIIEVRSVTNSQNLVRTTDFFTNSRTSGDTSGYKVVQPGSFVYNPSRVNVGSISWLQENDPVIVSPMYVVFSIDVSLVLPEFLMMQLTSSSVRASIVSNTVTGARNRLTFSSLSSIEIFVPSLSKQRELVGRLHRMSSLVDVLETELEVRKKQYEFYRDQLLTFPEDGEVRWVSMGEVGTFFGGLSGKTKADFENGSARFIAYTNIYNNIAVDQARADFVNVGVDEKQRQLLCGDILFTGSSEGLADVGMSSVVTSEPQGPLYLNSFSMGYRLAEGALLNPDFAKHLFRSVGLRKQIVRTASGVTRFNVSKAKMAKVRFPVPPAEVQAEIAEVLDKFYALINDIKIGLPAEIEARRKQYEYYRDKLLSFPEAAA